MSNYELGEDGLWRPAVPLPLYGWWHVTCWECWRRFWFGRGLKPAKYEQHYRAAHIGRSGI